MTMHPFLKKLVVLTGVLTCGGSSALAVTATPMPLDISAAVNYDAVGTANEVAYATAKNGTLASILGGHNLANSGRALTTTDSLTGGNTALPRYGAFGTYTCTFAYDKSSSGVYTASNNAVRIFALATNSTTVTSTVTVPIIANQQLNYNNLNFLFVQNRSNGGGTYQTTVTITNTDGTTTTRDTGATTIATGAPGGTLGGAGIGGQGGISNSTDVDANVANAFSSTYGVMTSGSTSVISSTAGSNLWQLATPQALTNSKVPKSITFTVTAAGAGNWNELVVFDVAATPRDYTAPPATDPAATLNITLTSRMQAHPRIMMTPATIASLQAFYNNKTQSQVWRNQFDAYVPASTPPTIDQCDWDATEAQRQGLWRLPTAALDYVLTGNQSAFNNAVGFLQFYVGLPDWECTIERNSGMAAANNMVGVALAYDWLYNNLDPTFREQVRQKLFLQARALYYGGYKEQNSNIGAIYWQLDPLNNHHWHRQAGLVLAMVACYNGDASENFMLNAAAGDAQLVNTWLPSDGTSHESVSYQVFGGNHLAMAQQACDDNLGTNLLGSGYFQNIGHYFMQMQAASFQGTLNFGDYSGYDDDGGYGNFLLLCATKTNDANLRTGALQLYAQNPSYINFSWWSLLWDNPNLTGGTWTNLPLSDYFGDLGISTYKDSWTPGGVTAMFKCCPMGGVSLGQFRDANSETYVNVGHDDPDANSFIFFMGNDPMMWSDWYSQRKQSGQQNTILVNNLGQNPAGRSPAGTAFSQPATSGSMLGMAKSFAPVTLVNGTIVSEGEAAGSYPAISGTGGRPALSRYRRLFMWSANHYMLVLDDIRSATSATYAQLIQGPGVTAVNTTLGQFKLATGTHNCPFQVVGSAPLTYSIVASTADNRSTSLGYQQLQTSAASTSLQLASIFNSWNLSALTVKIQNPTATTEDIVVTGTGVSDTYRWTYATSSTTQSSIIPLIAPVITSMAPTATATTGTAYSFNYTATGSPTPTYSVTNGALPNGLSISSTGAITGTPTQTGTFTGTVTATNAVAPDSAQNFSITVSSPGTSFTQWEQMFFNATQMNDPNTSGANANPANDGTVNLLKFIFDINPATNMSSTDRAQLPEVAIINVGGQNYLTLTHRQKPAITGVTINLQTSADLQAWSTVTPDLSQTVGTDTATGDPIVRVGVKITAASAGYIRLNVTMP